MPECLKHTVMHPTRFEVVSVFLTYGKGSLHVVQRNMNSINVTKLPLFQIGEVYPNNNGLFMHDGAHCH